jgi:hypothetical protein
MITYIKEIHNEEYSDNRQSLGVILNYSDDGWKESFIYIFTHQTKVYTFFDTIVDMIDYLVSQDKKIKRAYMYENEYDEYFDSPMDGTFREKLTWE